MTKLYPSVLVCCFLLFFFSSQKIVAQCNCKPGVPATPITYLDTILPTQASTSIFSFPKFDPSIGTLSCIEFNDTVSVVVTTFARNTDTTAGHNYTFVTSIGDVVNGPNNSGSYNWAASTQAGTKIYGPTYLDQDMIDMHPPQTRLPGDSVTYGPDTLINNAIGAGSPPDFAPFIGTTGSVNFDMELSGGAIAIVGGTNYLTGIKSNSWGTFRLTYYWCPTGTLANNIVNFTAFKNSGAVQLQWQDESAGTGVSYAIEYSTDGTSFLPAGYVNANSQESASSTQTFKYTYQSANTTPGKLYFRIRRIGTDGKASYSVIKSLSFSSSSLAGYQVYPNPVKNSVMLEFDEVQNGNFIVSIINTIGQVIQQKSVILNGTNQIKMDLVNKPAAGLYYLQAKDQTNNQQYISKILIR
ncbi:MAG: choice-of-anchor E domain-containing protein [Bacteroidetes bacterium]|nr:choice-of-anchor E domain-containing protein [Bacteroidota bacterium]MBS1933132.1 choice-of-anchor E domain-containing protein [Bacteroidota bacterium]